MVRPSPFMLTRPLPLKNFKTEKKPPQGSCGRATLKGCVWRGRAEVGPPNTHLDKGTQDKEDEIEDGQSRNDVAVQDHGLVGLMAGHQHVDHETHDGDAKHQAAQERLPPPAKQSSDTSLLGSICHLDCGLAFSWGLSFRLAFVTCLRQTTTGVEQGEGSLPDTQPPEKTPMGLNFSGMFQRYTDTLPA